MRRAQRIRRAHAAPAGQVDAPELVELRGGWWQLPDGRKVHGKQRALDALGKEG